MRIVCEKMSFGYVPEKLLFDHINFSIDKPGFHSIFGKSGCGKSTLAKILAGHLKASADKLEVPSKVLCCTSWEKFPSWCKLGDHFTHLLNNRPRMKKMLDVFELDDDIFSRYPHQVSTGQARRINLLRYILEEFDVLIMDEALHNVDEPTRASIIVKLKTWYGKNRILLYISHDVLDVVHYSDKITQLTIQEGKIDLTSLEGLDYYSINFRNNTEVDSLRHKLFQ